VADNNNGFCVLLVFYCSHENVFSPFLLGARKVCHRDVHVAGFVIDRNIGAIGGIERLDDGAMELGDVDVGLRDAVLEFESKKLSSFGFGQILLGQGWVGWWRVGLVRPICR
jgi:hypothetical protein